MLGRLSAPSWGESLGEGSSTSSSLLVDEGLVDEEGNLRSDWKRSTTEEEGAPCLSSVSPTHPTSPLYSGLMRSKVRTAYLHENAA